MRLINVKTYEVVEHPLDDALQYAILSHTWGAEEITLREMQHLDEGVKARRGFKKIEYTCLQAQREGLDWAWVDTCCIDKTSSAELSEAINSMFRWYQQSKICYVYLADLPDRTSLGTGYLAGCRWFTRGWCLQELLAPSSLAFYSQNWHHVGGLSDLVESVFEITGIDKVYLTNQAPLDRASIATRMSWAAGRQCTRLEDSAYSLLGIFDVNMPLLYGEGKKAFTRLQEEIWRETDDHSLLAWRVTVDDPRALKLTGVFAESPNDFHFSSRVVPTGLEEGVPSGMTKRGLSLFVSTRKLAYPFSSRGSVYMIPLNCEDRGVPEKSTGERIMLLASGIGPLLNETFARVATPAHFYADSFNNFEANDGNTDAGNTKTRTVYVQKRLTVLDRPPDEMHVTMPENQVLFRLGGPMRPYWYESEWKLDHDAYAFPAAPWRPMGDFKWFMRYNRPPEYLDSSYFVLPLGGPMCSYMDRTAAVIDTSALSRHDDAPRYAQFLLVSREAVGFRVGMQKPVEIRCGVKFLPYETQTCISLLPWDEKERAKAAGPLYHTDYEDSQREHRRQLLKWTADNLCRARIKEAAHGLVVVAEASLVLKNKQKGGKLHVEMLIEKRPNADAEELGPGDLVSPHVHLHFTMLDS